MSEVERAALLRALEERLLDPAVRHSADELSQLLADDFVEFGRSGRVYNKPQIISRHSGELVTGALPVAKLGDFVARPLAPDAMLLTYRATERAGEGAASSDSRRCSIWQLIGGRWQLIFHQGTPVPSPQPRRH